MERFIGWWKEEGRLPMCGGRPGEPRYATLVKSLLLGLLPIVCCIIYCALQGHWIGEVYLPSSRWNDELFYYKQVEGILRYGYPLGYFGFNESHALRLSFAAWSPVLVFPWILWGLLFGWNLMSPVICNIFLMSLTCFLFVWLVRPSWKQIGILAALFALYTPFARYMLSGMAEVICFAMLILFYGLAVNYLRREKGCKLAALFLMSAVMTLMRPYFAMFLFLPAYLWIAGARGRARKCMAAAGSLLALGAAFGAYAGIKHYLGAEYFAPLFFTDWIYAFLEQGLWGGFVSMLKQLYYVGKVFLDHIGDGLRTGLNSGTIFAGYLVCLGVVLVQCARDGYKYRKQRREGIEDRTEKERLVTEGHLAFSLTGMLFALFLMYKLTEGSRHLLTFMAAAVFLTALMETRFFLKAIVMGAAFAYLYICMAVNPFDWQVPFRQEEREASLEEWQQVFAGQFRLDRTDAPGYGNVVIWVYEDTVEGELAYTPWQLLYGLPEGFGISCCMPDYVTEHIDDLQSRYLAGPVGGKVDVLCGEAGYRELHRDREMVLYEIWR